MQCLCSESISVLFTIQLTGSEPDKSLVTF